MQSVIKNTENRQMSEFGKIFTPLLGYMLKSA
jgi:hypothetical protein